MMRRNPLLTIALCGMLLGPVAAGRVQAQQTAANSFGIGIGFGFNYGPNSSSYGGPSFGVFPLWYPGFYGNGISMYGPPIPTYAPVPGVFGAADNSVIQNAPMISPGTALGVGASLFDSSSSGSQGRQLSGSATYNRPVSPNGEPMRLDERVLGGSIPGMNILLVEVRLPIANATVFFDNHYARSRGNVRLYSSPALKLGETYKYAVRAEWIINGRKTSYTQLVQGKAGERVVADFLR